MRRVCVAAGAALLLAGCATARLSREPLAPAAQESVLRGLAGFRLDGRAAVRAGEEGSPPATLSWVQQAAESRLKLSGPIGAGGLTLVFSPDSLQVISSKGETYRDAEAQQILAAELGFVPPFDALRYWVLGLAAPGEAPADQQTDAAGRIAGMTQQGWRIQYERWKPLVTRAGAVQLPHKLTAAHADLRLQLVVDRWKLQAVD